MAVEAVLSETIQSLKAELSLDASINFAGDEAFHVNAARWSEYKAPQPGAVVNVATESDIERTVVWANANGVKFLAQSGGHGWTTTFHLGKGDIIINLRAIREVVVDQAAGTATIGAGALVGEAVEELHKNKVNAALGTCNSVGVVGAILGGGLSRTQGLFGIGVDNMISVRLVTAEGKVVSVSATENSDLWWGLRGAGHGFGIVSKLVIKTHPEINGGQQWVSNLIFTPDKIELISEAVSGLDWDRGMAVNLFMMNMPPDMKPLVLFSYCYPGPEEPGRRSIASLLSAGPIMEQSGMTPYNLVNAGADAFGIKGGDKPGLSSSFKNFKPGVLTEIWNLLTEFLGKYPQAVQSTVIFEFYPVKKLEEVGDDETAFPHRHVPFHGLLVPIYPAGDDSVEADAVQLGKKFRSILDSTWGISEKHVYVNFAGGDESKETLYGSGARLERLVALKKKWDPLGHFDQFNPIV